VERQPTRSYGHTWADWLYGREKDAFMAGVYDDCGRIDHCPDGLTKAARILRLRDKLTGSNRAWVEGVLDFLDFESHRLALGRAPLTRLGAAADFEVLAVIDAAYRHGAFRGLCRTPGGAEWIGLLGELSAVMVHQGFKWLRSGDVDDWELPGLGEAWCKGVAMWGLLSLFLAVDAGGDDADNDEALHRIHTLVGAHHLAGTVWAAYRGPHPHQGWDRTVRGTAPAEGAIRQFGAWSRWPPELTDILVRSARQVNTWTNPPGQPVHLTRVRGLALGEHTPRLNVRCNQVVDELVALAGDMTPAEITETRWRCGSWLATFTSVWRGRGDLSDCVVELSAFGALLGVLRESRPHITSRLAAGIMRWSRDRTDHLRPDEQQKLLDEVRATVEIRGRVPGAALVGAGARRFTGGLLGTSALDIRSVSAGSADAGARRFTDGVWGLAELCVIQSRHGGREIPEDMRELTVRLFDALTDHRRRPGVDVEVGQVNTDCAVCVGDELFRGLVDNRPSPGVWHGTIWGALIYANFGLGTGDDVDLGTR
jgi:hypothetical protein